MPPQRFSRLAVFAVPNHNNMKYLITVAVIIGAFILTYPLAMKEQKDQPIENQAESDYREDVYSDYRYEQREIDAEYENFRNDQYN